MLKQDKLKTVHNLLIDEEQAPQRLDNFLFNKIKKVPKSRIYRMIRSGEVRVNKKRVSVSYKLQPKDRVRIPPFWSDAKTTWKKPADKLINLLFDNIIFEDKRILVVNKPAGLATHGGSGISFGVIEILRGLTRPRLILGSDPYKNLELVHRLDKETSGCLILAKRKSALRELHRLFREGKVLKKYILLVKGRWKGGVRKVDLPLLKNQLRSGERMVKINDEGKESLTIFKPLQIGSKVSLIEATLKTGRTHQIRVHAAHIGYPIVGDNKYGDKRFNSEMKKTGLKRLFLHAEKLSFCWDDGEKVILKAPLDEDLKALISSFLIKFI